MTIDAGGGGGADDLTGMAIQSDGGIVIAGTVNGNAVQVSRRTDIGFPDASFATATITMGAVSAVTPRIALLSDGRIAVAATATKADGTTDIGIAILNADGSPDTSFDGDGMALFDFGGNEVSQDVAVDGMNRILVGGSKAGAGFLLARALPNGQLDAGFNASGTPGSVIGTTNGAVKNDVFRAVNVVPGNKIMTAGQAMVTSHGNEPYVWRFNEDGSPDTTFNAPNGKIRIYAGSCDGAGGNAFHDYVLQGSLTTDAAGNIYAGGARNMNDGSYNSLAIRLGPDGGTTSFYNTKTCRIANHDQTAAAVEEGFFDVQAVPGGPVVWGGKAATDGPDLDLLLVKE